MPKPSTQTLYFAKCVRCDPHGRGRKVGQYLGRSYSAGEWSESPVCDNCKGPMTMLFKTGLRVR